MTLEQCEFELCGSTYMWYFSTKHGSKTWDAKSLYTEGWLFIHAGSAGLTVRLEYVWILICEGILEAIPQIRGDHCSYPNEASYWWKLMSVKTSVVKSNSSRIQDSELSPIRMNLFCIYMYISICIYTYIFTLTQIIKEKIYFQIQTQTYTIFHTYK